MKPVTARGIPGNKQGEQMNSKMIAVLAVAAGMAAAWYVSGEWMQQFADSRLLSPAWYALLALLLLALVVAVVVLKAWRIANENPVLSIKSE